MINIYHDDKEGWEVWTDPEGADKDGRCIGVGDTRDAALKDALVELSEDLNDLSKGLAGEVLA